jgi:hypothetical protein
MQAHHQEISSTRKTGVVARGNHIPTNLAIPNESSPVKIKPIMNAKVGRISIADYPAIPTNEQSN